MFYLKDTMRHYCGWDTRTSQKHKSLIGVVKEKTYTIVMYSFLSVTATYSEILLYKI